MQWLDIVLVLLMVAVVVFEGRQEAGRAILDTVAGLGAYHLTHLYDEPLTQLLGLKGLPDSHASPMAQLALFAGLLGLGLILARLLHKQSRWSMDRWDPVFGIIFGLVLSALIGHTSADLATRMTMAPNGVPASFVANSNFAHELRTFSSYREFIREFDGMRYTPQQ
jgi:hypothetical protein